MAYPDGVIQTTSFGYKVFGRTPSPYPGWTSSETNRLLMIGGWRVDRNWTIDSTSGVRPRHDVETKVRKVLPYLFRAHGSLERACWDCVTAVVPDAVRDLDEGSICSLESCSAPVASPCRCCGRLLCSSHISDIEHSWEIAVEPRSDADGNERCVETYVVHLVDSERRYCSGCQQRMVERGKVAMDQGFKDFADQQDGAIGGPTRELQNLPIYLRQIYKWPYFVAIDSERVPGLSRSQRARHTEKEKSQLPKRTGELAQRLNEEMRQLILDAAQGST